MDFLGESDFLPDLVDGNVYDPGDKPFSKPVTDSTNVQELILFDKVVRKRNKDFVRCNQAVINWFTSAENDRVYPPSATNNRNRFKRHMKLFQYDDKYGILYKRVKCSDNIGKFILFHRPLRIHKC